MSGCCTTRRCRFSSPACAAATWTSRIASASSPATPAAAPPPSWRPAPPETKHTPHGCRVYARMHAWHSCMHRSIHGVIVRLSLAPRVRAAGQPLNPPERFLFWAQRVRRGQGVPALGRCEQHACTVGAACWDRRGYSGLCSVRGQGGRPLAFLEGLARGAAATAMAENAYHQRYVAASVLTGVYGRLHDAVAMLGAWGLCPAKCAGWGGGCIAQSGCRGWGADDPQGSARRQPCISEHTSCQAASVWAPVHVAACSRS